MGDEGILWEVRSLDELKNEDLLLVSEFLNDNFPGTYFPKCSPNIFEWKLGIKNPAGRGFITAAMYQGRVIGVFTITRKSMYMEGQKLDVGEIGDAYTHPKYRKGGRCVSPKQHLDANDEYFEKSIFGRLVVETLYRAKISGVQFIYGTPNQIVRPSYLKRLNFVECNYKRIYSQYVLTRNFARPKLFSLLYKVASRISFGYCKLLLQFFHGKNSIVEVDASGILGNLLVGSNSKIVDMGGLAMSVDRDYVLHRYVNHPTLRYTYFQVISRRGVIGYLIATRLVRASGVKTLVISDWIEVQPEFRKKFNLIIGYLRKFSMDSQTISLWKSNKTSRYNLFLSGIFSTKEISIVGKSLIKEIPSENYLFFDFRFGWSDNG